MRKYSQLEVYIQYEVIFLSEPMHPSSLYNVLEAEPVVDELILTASVLSCSTPQDPPWGIAHGAEEQEPPRRDPREVRPSVRPTPSTLACSSYTLIAHWANLSRYFVRGDAGSAWGVGGVQEFWVGGVGGAFGLRRLSS